MHKNVVYLKKKKSCLRVDSVKRIIIKGIDFFISSFSDELHDFLLLQLLY